MTTKESNVVKKETLLPVNRVKIIMKSSPNTENVAQDALFIVARTTEYFVRHLARKAYEMHKTERPRVLDYPSLADTVQTSDNLSFLKEIIPRKITVREYKEILKRKPK